MKPTTEILKRIRNSSADHKDGVFTRLYYEAQVDYYTNYIPKNPAWKYAGLYADV